MLQTQISKENVAFALGCPKCARHMLLAKGPTLAAAACSHRRRRDEGRRARRRHLSLAPLLHLRQRVL